MMVAPNIAEDQFIFDAVVGVASGQHAKNQIGARNIREAMLMERPYLPSDHRRGGRGGPAVRLQMRQLIVMKYDERIDTPPSELIAFRAVDEPRLMQASRELTTRETHTARSGIFQPGVTRDSQFEPGNPRSRAKDQICLDAVAISLMQQKLSNITTTAVMVFVAA